MKYLLIFTLFLTSISFGQSFPKLSPKASIEQKVGLCNIQIDYSRPSKRDRDVFGDLVPYEEVWRLGANECTKLTIDQPMLFDGKKLDTGKYAVFAIPREGGDWDIIFNSDHEQWGSLAYDEEKNVLVTQASANTSDCNSTETFTIAINNITNYGGTFIFKWDKTKVKLPFTLDTDTQVKQMIALAIEEGKELEKVHYRAASYFLKNEEDPALALDHIEKSIAIERGYYNVFLKAQILAKQGKMKDANKLGNEAKDLALKADKKDWADYMQEKMDEWKK